MADERKVIYLEINASKAVDGSSAATRALAAIEKSTASMGGSLDRMEASLNRVGGYLKAHLALLIADIGARLFDMAKSSLDAAANMGELADQMGVSVKGLQALQFAAAQNNVEFSQLETGVAKFSQKIGEAATGSKPMLDALNNLGVKILDANGKLRSNETLIEDVAAAILKIEDPAKRAAASVEFFSRSGAKFQPMLQAMARGFDDMGTEAQKAGALIDEKVSARLDKLGDSWERSKLKARAYFAETAVSLLDFYDKYESAAKKRQAASAADELAFRDFMDSTMSHVVGIAAAIVEVFRGAADQTVKFWIAAFNDMLAGAEALVNKMASIKMPGFLGSGDVKLFDPVNLGRIPGGNPSASDFVAGVQGAFTTTRDSVQQAYTRGRSGWGQATDGTMWSVLNDGLPAKDGAPRGASNPAATGAGKSAEDAAKKYEKLKDQLGLTAKAQVAMTEAARAGDVAFEEQKATLEAQQKVLDIFGVTVGRGNEKLEELRKLLIEISQGKAAESFNVATTALEQQNVILEAQIRLRNELPEVQAREIANIKAAQEAQKAGTALLDSDKQRRLDALDIGERLKIQAEDLKRSQELWTEPLKSALQSIQQTAADAFESMLESGKVNFEALGQVFKKIVIRMAAEWLALATVRPTMSVLVNAVSPSMARQFGLDSGSAGGVSSLSGGGMYGGGGFSDLFSGIGDSLSNAWARTQGFFGVTPSGGYSDVGALINAQGLGQSSILGSGIGWGQGLGALAGAGMGIYQLASGGGSTASTIGGIASLVGAGVSLIPGIGQIAGPIIGLLGGILPGLFGGDSKPTVTNQGYGQLSWGAGGFGTSGGAWGPNANAQSLQGPLGQMGQTIQGLFDLLGGVKDASRVWGVALESMSQGNGDWQFDGQTSFLVGPDGSKRQWGMGSNDADIGMATAGAKAAISSILDGAVGDITDNLRKALESIDQTEGGATLEQLGQTIAEIKTFDDAIAGLGKTVTGAEQALKAIDDQFAGLFATAEKYGLDTAAADAAKITARTKVATDFADGLQRALDDMVDPTKGLLADLEKEKQAAIDTNRYIVENVTGSLDQIARIEELYGKRRADIARAAAERDHAFFAAQRQNEVAGWSVTDPMRAAFAGTNERFGSAITDAVSIGGSPADGSSVTARTIELITQATAAYEAERARLVDDFIGGLRTGITQVADPMRATIEALGKTRDANLVAAQAIADITGNTVALTLAQESYDTSLQRLADDFIGGLTDAITALENPTQAAIDGFNRVHATNLLAATSLADLAGRTEAVTAANDLLAKQLDNLLTTTVKGWQAGALGITDPVGAQRAGIEDTFAANRRIAETLGSTEALAAATALYDAQIQQLEKTVAETQRGYDDFTRGLKDGITALADPMQAQLDALQAQLDANTRQAEAIRDATGATEALTLSQELYAKSVAKIADDFVTGLQEQALALQNPMAATLAGFAKDRDAGLLAANALGVGTYAVNELYGTRVNRTAGDFTEGLSDQLAGLREPMAASLRALADQRDANVLAATAIADVTGRTEALDLANQLYSASVDKLSADFTDGIAQQTAALTGGIQAQIAEITRQRAANIQAAAAIDGVTGGTEAMTAAMGLASAQLGKLVKDFGDRFTTGLMGMVDPMRAQLAGWANQRATDLDDAAALGVSAAGVTDYYKALFNKAANDNNKEIERGLMDPLAAQIDVLHETRDAAMLAADAINDFAKTMGTAMVDTVKLADYYAQQEADIKKRHFTQIDDLIKSLLPGGALANVDPRAHLAGLEATYRATYAQASAGDSLAAERYSADASALADYAKSFFGGSTDYNRYRDEILANAMTIAGNAGGATSTTGASNDQAIATLTGRVQQLLAVVEKQSQENAELRADQKRLMGLLSRYVSDKAA